MGLFSTLLLKENKSKLNALLFSVVFASLSATVLISQGILKYKFL